MNAIASKAASTTALGPPSLRRPTGKLRRAAQGFLIVALLTPLIWAGRVLLAALAATHAVHIPPIEPPTVRVVPVVDEVVASGTYYSAVVKELQKAEISFRVGGTVAYLLKVEGPGGRARNVQDGDQVGKGVVLARLDPSDYQRERSMAVERLASAEARLQQTQADAELAKLDHDRTARLAARGSATQAELDAARSKLQSTSATAMVAKRDVESSRISLQQAEANLEYCTLTAPFDRAMVASRMIENFERVTAGQRAFLLLDLSSVVVSFSVPDGMVGRLAIGQPVEVTCDALSGRRFAGLIHKIGSTADAQTRTYAVEVRVDRPEGLRPGMVATAHFRRERRAFLLPLTAVAAGEGRTIAVYRVSSEGGKSVARRVPVGFDDVLDNRLAVRLDPETADGLRPGDLVVATGVHRLRDGEVVKVAE